MALILLRHAPPPVALQRRYWGHTDIPLDTAPFDPALVRALGKYRFGHVYCSDLSRCIQTLERMGVSGFITDPRLREVRFKPLIEGKTFDEVAELETFHPSLLDGEERWHAFLCAESRSSFESRLAEFLKALPSEHDILLCTHAGVIRTIASLYGISVSSIGYLEHLIVGDKPFQHEI